MLFGKTKRPKIPTASIRDALDDWDDKVITNCDALDALAAAGDEIHDAREELNSDIAQRIIAQIADLQTKESAYALQYEVFHSMQRERPLTDPVR
jgi:hypothetical protein